MVRLHLLLVLPAVASSMSVLYVKKARCSGDLALSDFQATCTDNDGSPCTFGSEAQVTGFLKSRYGFRKETQFVMKSCIWGFCEEEYDDEINLCEHLTGISGSQQSDNEDGEEGPECPAAGTYFFYETLTIPEKGNAFTFKISMASSADEEKSGDEENSSMGVLCTVKVGISNKYQMAWSAAGVLMLAGLGVALYRKKNRTLSCSKDSRNDEHGSNLNNFRVMEDPNTGITSPVV